MSFSPSAVELGRVMLPVELAVQKGNQLCRQNWVTLMSICCLGQQCDWCVLAAPTAEQTHR